VRLAEGIMIAKFFGELAALAPPSLSSLPGLTPQSIFRAKNALTKVMDTRVNPAYDDLRAAFAPQTS
jgi:hypothetical protein